MCGIAGIAGFRDDQLLERMSGVIQHRGPDGDGVFLSETHSLAHRRLSIIDPEGGVQPMLGRKEKVALIFNGEIYNFMELRSILEEMGYVFETRSDTEVLLAGYLLWGIDMVNRLNGMFAFAISDQRRSKPVLYLARDPMGVKPLYYHFEEGRLIFASEIKAVLQSDAVSRTLYPPAMDLYLRYRYVPGPDTLFRQVRKLPPGSIMEYKDGHMEIHGYWRPKVPSYKRLLNEEEAMEQLGQRLISSLKYRMIADAPVGAYLSEGLDSSVIVALMSRYTRVETFTVGFDSDHDELSGAAETARLLGTHHHEIRCGPEHFKLMEKVIYHLDQPVGDAIILPMYLLAAEAAKSVKVVLCGEGADEIFGGYLFHKVIRMAGLYRRLTPRFLRKLTCVLANATPHRFLNLMFSYPADLGEAGKNKFLHFLDLVENSDLKSMYRFLITLFDDQALKQLYKPAFHEALKKEMKPLDEWETNGDALDQLLFFQYRDWLPDLMLNKLDKLTMAHSLEGRFVYLDPELVAFANGLESHWKVRGRTDKYLLRQYAAQRLNLTAAKQKKKPFFIPMEQIRGVETHFDQLDFLNTDHITVGAQEFMKRRQEISLWLLNLFCQVHKVDTRF